MAFAAPPDEAQLWQYQAEMSCLQAKIAEMRNMDMAVAAAVTVPLLRAGVYPGCGHSAPLPSHAVASQAVCYTTPGVVPPNTGGYGGGGREVPSSDILVERRRHFAGRLVRLWVEDCSERGGIRVHALDTSSFGRTHADISDASLQLMFDDYWHRKGKSNLHGDHDQDLQEFLRQLLDQAYFDSHDDSNELELRIPDTVQPLKVTPEVQMIQVPVTKPAATPGSPLSKEWIRDTILVPRGVVCARHASSREASRCFYSSASDTSRWLTPPSQSRPSSARSQPHRTAGRPHSAPSRRAACTPEAAQMRVKAARTEYKQDVPPNMSKNRAQAAKGSNGAGSAPGVGGQGKPWPRPHSARAAVRAANLRSTSSERSSQLQQRQQANAPAVQRTRDDADGLLVLQPSHAQRPQRSRPASAGRSTAGVLHATSGRPPVLAAAANSSKRRPESARSSLPPCDEEHFLNGDRRIPKPLGAAPRDLAAHVLLESWNDLCTSDIVADDSCGLVSVYEDLEATSFPSLCEAASAAVSQEWRPPPLPQQEHSGQMANAEVQRAVRDCMSARLRPLPAALHTHAVGTGAHDCRRDFVDAGASIEQPKEPRPSTPPRCRRGRM
eukprot:TRINITY_DN60002_c0_g1_i1.p1 TRINITY_DN60002_c0_g1~~TRINITY_DN60002_c0_g1_i1.p1  ORF type:complete len:610 (+),score=44.41 TRINITY_DN60002_c0_g1_i1:88-1917(+)